MSEFLIQSETLDAIADAINAKTGGTSAMTPAQMVTAIGNISGGGGGNTLESDFLTVYKETVEVGENTVSNSVQYQAYLASIKSIPGTLFAMSIHKKASYVYNEWANGSIGGLSRSGYRFRNGSWTGTAWGNSSYDAVAPVGTLVDVYTFVLKDPSNE